MPSRRIRYFRSLRLHRGDDVALLEERFDDAGAGAPHQRRLFALLDLDGTLFHMLPEAEVPTNLEAICEGVVPLDAPVPGPAAAATPARHVLCVRKGTRALLAATCVAYALGLREAARYTGVVRRMMG